MYTLYRDTLFIDIHFTGVNFTGTQFTGIDLDCILETGKDHAYDVSILVYFLEH